MSAVARLLAQDAAALEATILKNVRRELHEVHAQTVGRLEGRYSPTADAKAALRAVERLAVALEAMLMIMEARHAS